jgi:multimeric flavodoxin WrbA
MRPLEVKILGISGTPVKGGNCDIYVQESLKAAAEIEGVSTEFVSLADKKIEMCTHCQWCMKNRAPCNVEDDAKEVWEKIFLSDGIIFGAPTWVNTLCPSLMILWSRARYYAFFTRELVNKVAGYLTVGFFGWGLEHALDTMENLTKIFMIPVARGWATASRAAFGERPSFLEHGVLDDSAGILRARNVAWRVVEVSRLIKYATEAGIQLPEEYRPTFTGSRLKGVEEKVFVDGVWREKRRSNKVSKL